MDGLGMKDLDNHRLSQSKGEAIGEGRDDVFGGRFTCLTDNVNDLLYDLLIARTAINDALKLLDCCFQRGLVEKFNSVFPNGWDDYCPL